MDYSKIKIFEEVRKTTLKPLSMLFYNGKTPTAEQLAKFMSESLGLEQDEKEALDEAADNATLFLSDWKKAKKARLVRSFVSSALLDETFALAMDNDGTIVCFRAEAVMDIRERERQGKPEEIGTIYSGFISKFTAADLGSHKMLEGEVTAEA